MPPGFMKMSGDELDVMSITSRLIDLKSLTIIIYSFLLDNRQVRLYKCAKDGLNDI